MTRIKIEIHERRNKTSIIIERARYSEAETKALEFLKSNEPEGYEVEAHAPRTRFKPEYIPEWLMVYDVNNLSQKEKVFLLLKNNHSNEWMRSQDLMVEYEEVYGESIKLSSLSTYLARFYEEGSLERMGSRAQREYKLLEGAAASSL